MSVKSLLREALASYRGSHKSVPDVPFVATQFDIATGYPTEQSSFPRYVAPTDGLAVLQADATAGATSLVIRMKGVLYDIINIPGDGISWPCGNAPCKKGDVVGFYVLGTKSTARVYLRFYSYVGAQ